MLTIKEVEKQAATSPKAALECSIRHWWENAHLTPKELEQVDCEPCGGEMCALCSRYHEDRGSDCGKCPLAKIECCNDYDSTWGKAYTAFDIWDDNPTTQTFKVWQKAAWAMHRKLCSLRT